VGGPLVSGVPPLTHWPGFDCRLEEGRAGFCRYILGVDTVRRGEMKAVVNTGCEYGVVIGLCGSGSLNVG